MNITITTVITNVNINNSLFISVQYKMQNFLQQYQGATGQPRLT